MQSFKIALLGDTIFDGWGDDCIELQQEFRRQYSHSEFQVENHGLRETRAGYGLWRVANDYEKNGKLVSSISNSNPDVIILDSFAYTNRADGPEGMSEYRDILRRIVEEIHHTTTARIIFCLTIPPHREKFLENVPNYFNTARVTRQRLADDVRLYLDEARRIAQDEEWPIADIGAEIEKRVKGGENVRRFINQSNNLLPSRYGYATMARVLVRAIDNHRMIEEVITK